MIWVFVVVGAVLVFAIAAAAVGTETFRLGHSPPPTIFDLEEAVDHAVGTLPSHATARLSVEDVRVLISFELDHLAAKGVFALPGRELTPPSGPPVLIADDDAVGYVLGRCDEIGLDVEDEDVFAVIESLLAYLDRIGAIGPSVPGPVDPDDDR